MIVMNGNIALVGFAASVLRRDPWPEWHWLLKRPTALPPQTWTAWKCAPGHPSAALLSMFDRIEDDLRALMLNTTIEEQPTWQPT